ncbi:alkaline phosphatase PhoX [Streptomyces sp. V4-01]|uniref:Alkaline phosphatase PhoX n=1 Tax=Actinacidiphila polyblastidii TaxID=3110430 RepID=A0ABU7P6M2_9ACTN|nr:alkaline phosphatase PhoX [Streptomyces sp. V4-01]
MVGERQEPEPGEWRDGDAGPGYGPLVDDPAGLLALPAGFSYRVVARAAVTTPEPGGPTPPHPAAAFPGEHGATLLVAGHAPGGPRSDRPYPAAVADLVYDAAAAGGCTVVEVPHDGQDRHDGQPGEGVREWVALAGASANRGGGATPWGTWLAGEETEDLAGVRGMTRDHGYVFEVDPHDRLTNRHPKPLKALGRYAHAAVVVDPGRGHLYLTEDASAPDGLLYRWTAPEGFAHGRGRLAALDDTAGALQAFRCFDSGGRFVADLSRAARIGTVYGVDWVDVPDRDARSTSVRRQFPEGRVTRARTQASMWWADGGAYVVASHGRGESPGGHGGAVWFYNPSRRTLTLKVLLDVGTGAEQDLGAVTVSPFGGLIAAGDVGGVPHLLGVLDDGRTHPLARSRLDARAARRPEHGAFTGLAFSPDGETLFAGIRTPGVVLAITGPWRRRG